MPTTTATNAIITQLRALAALTNTEIMIAETRTAQARSAAVSKELRENAKNGRKRTEEIEDTIRRFGAVPAFIGPVAGRIGATIKTVFEQAQPFDEAVLGDLALEHQLLGRSTYLRALAVQVEDQTLTELADRLITAHQATVDWLTTVLAEEALGGPAALRRTPLQSAAALATTVLNLPGGWVTDIGDHLAESAKQEPARVGELVNFGRGGATPTADELPIEGYEDLNASAAIDAIRSLRNPKDIRRVVAFEDATKNRSTVVSAAQTHVAAIAKDTVGVS
ncbi:ferritin-like domain-containing protein [Antrihabitans sp. NCIMB 15449]|uniref:Ferritin-like domain-containing protein n=1 Tax=Antrihabitans spumae TaxID=3373370 RepID=A0ABW7JPG2_9NOCA